MQVFKVNNKARLITTLQKSVDFLGQKYAINIMLQLTQVETSKICVKNKIVQKVDEGD